MKTFLVVDDSRVLRKIARQMLEDLEFDVSEAENGRVAMDACAQAMPDGILLDWNMPVTDGPAFLSELRGSAHGDEPKVIFCTTEGDIDHITQALQGGADEYIMKPFNAEILKEKLAQVGLA